MSNLDDVNKWAAEQCESGGIEIQDPSSANEVKIRYYITEDMGSWIEWTIEDARCREVVREKFGIVTQYFPQAEGWSCLEYVTDEVHEIYKTISEAEISCITNIFEASHP